MTRALVVYESMWGNTELLARAVAEGIAAVMPVDVTDVAAAPLELGDVTLVVAGGPTHGHSMSRAESRRWMRSQGALHGSVCTGLREWLDDLPDERDRWLATFDTRVSGPHLPGSAAGSAARAGHRHHFHPVGRPRTFHLVGGDGPLVEGELDRAREWGRMVAEAVPTAGTSAPGRHLSRGRGRRRPAGGAPAGAPMDVVEEPVDAAVLLAPVLLEPVLVEPLPADAMLLHLPQAHDADLRHPVPVSSDPVTPDPVTPDPVTPDPVTPDPVTPRVRSTVDYDPPLARLVERVHALRARVGPGRPVVVGVAGEPGAGKSTLTAALVAALVAEGTRAVLVPMDGFHLANVALAALGKAERKGAIDTFDGAGYAALLSRVRDGGPHTVWAPTYDRAIEESVANAIEVAPGTEVVVTEGNYLLVDEGPWSAVRGLLDEAWAVEVDPQVRSSRLLARHVEFGKPPATAAAWVASVDDPNAAFVRATFGRADLVVRGT